MSQDLAERMLATRKAGPVDDLSFREFQVLLGVVAGLRGKELGYALDLSPKTVCTYRSRVLAKLGLGGDAALVRFAVGAGLVEEPSGALRPARTGLG